jgi:hypothetical protein
MHDAETIDTDPVAPAVAPPVLKLHMFRSVGMAASHDETNCFPNNRLSFGNRGAMNLQLASRVTEVLACAEEMWEFIEECRASPARWRNPAIAALADVTREEWEECLSRYTM